MWKMLKKLGTKRFRHMRCLRMMFPTPRAAGRFTAGRRGSVPTGPGIATYVTQRNVLLCSHAQLTSW